MKLSQFIYVLIFILVMSVGMAYAEVAPISEILVSDVDNQGNGEDLQISFVTEAVGIKHQLMVVPADDPFDIDTAMASESFLIVFPDTEQFSRNLRATSQDVNGEGIVEGIAYQVYILVDESALSEASQPITLQNETVVTTLVPELRAATGGLDTDEDGNVYFSDFGEPQVARGATVYRITPDGDVSIFFSTDALQGASGNEFDSQGNFYQSSIRSGRVLRVTPEGEVTFYSDDEFKSPVGIVIDDEDALYVTNCGGSSIQRVTIDEESSVFAQSSLLNCPNGITMDDDGNFYVSNYNDGKVLKIALDGEVEEFVELSGRSNAHLMYYEGLLYVVSRGGHRIYTVTLDGEVTVFAGNGDRGNDDAAALEATFNLPNDLSFSPDGQILYVNDKLITTDKLNFPGVLRAIILPRSE